MKPQDLQSDRPRYVNISPKCLDSRNKQCRRRSDAAFRSASSMFAIQPPHFRYITKKCSGLVPILAREHIAVETARVYHLYKVSVPHSIATIWSAGDRAHHVSREMCLRLLHMKSGAQSRSFTAFSFPP